MPTPVEQIILQVAQQHGIAPEDIWIPVTIASGEGGLGEPKAWGDPTSSNPAAQAVGPFALHDDGAGSGMTVEERLDPTRNASVMMPAIAKAISDGKALGLSGFDLLEYVWFLAEKPAGYDEYVRGETPPPSATSNMRNAYNTIGPKYSQGEQLPSVLENVPDLPPSVFGMTPPSQEMLGRLANAEVGFKEVVGPNGELAGYQLYDLTTGKSITTEGSFFTPEAWNWEMRGELTPQPPDPLDQAAQSINLILAQVQAGLLGEEQAWNRFMAAYRAAEMKLTEWQGEMDRRFGIEDRALARESAVAARDLGLKEEATDRARIIAQEILPKAIPYGQSINIPGLGSIPMTPVNLTQLFDQGLGPLSASPPISAQPAADFASLPPPPTSDLPTMPPPQQVPNTGLSPQILQALGLL